MTYSDFLNSLVSPISNFINWLSIVFNYLITNYFFITILGLTLISSLLVYFLNSLLSNLHSHSKDIDNYNEKGGSL